MNSTPTRLRARTALLADLVLAAACLGGLALVLPPAFAPPAVGPRAPEQPVGHVARLTSDVRRRTRGALVWDGLRAEAELYGEDTLYASAGSQAELVLEDGARLTLDESSLVVLRRRGRDPGPGEGAVPEGAVSIELVRGGAHGVAGTRALEVRSGGSRVVLAPAARARIERGAQGGPTVSVVRGRVALASAGRARSELLPGERVDASGRVERAPVALVAPEDEALLEPPRSGSPLVFRWSGSGSPAPCTLEVATDRTFAEPVVRVAVRSGTWSVPRLAPGLYHWRVGCPLSGALSWSSPRVLQLAVVALPLPYAPRAEELVDLSRGGRVVLAWSEVAGAARYRVQLSRDVEFAQSVSELEALRPSLAVGERLSEGRYCFRVREAGAEGSWSRASCFRLVTHPVLEAPRVYQPRRELVRPGQQGLLLFEWILPSAHAAEGPRSALVLRWDPIAGATRYVLEIAEDREFQRPVVVERVTDPWFRWAVIPRRDYYWRVRGIDGNGREGALSEVLRIGSEASAPRPLSPTSGQRLALPQQGGVLLSWEGSRALTSFRVEVARDPAFSNGVQTFRTRDSSWPLQVSQPGAFSWRVTGVDLNGQSTEPSAAQTVVLAAPAPEPSAPADEAVVWVRGARGAVRLEWAAPVGDSYEVELSAGPLSMTLQRAASWVEVDLPRAGSWRWRVRSKDPESAWSVRRRFELRVAPPQLLSPRPGDALIAEGATSLEVSWTPVPFAESYVVALFEEGAASPRLTEVRQPPLWVAVAPGQRSRLQVRAALRDSGDRRVWVEGAACPFTVAAAPASTDSVAAPSLAPSVAPSAAVVTGPPPQATGKGAVVRLGAAIAVLSNLGSVVTPAFSLQAELRLRRSGGLAGLVASVGYYGAAQHFGDGTADARARIDVLPVDVSALWTVPISSVTARVSAGPQVRIFRGRVVIDQVLEQSSTRVELGAVVRAGIERPVGPGTAFVELGLGVATRSAGLFATTPATLTAGVGYGVGLR